MKYKESDLLSVLVNLYGSQEAFITEYQNMLAEKLLGARDYKIDEEIKNLELLKKRFGESYLQACNIIVKDIKESKRVTNNIHSNFDKEMISDRSFQENHQFLTFDKLNGVYVSKGYWPIDYDYQGFKLPGELERVFAVFSEKFSKVKVQRKLIWHNELGHVNLKLSFDNGEFLFRCFPIHAILISYFDDSKCNDRDGVSSEFLAKQLGLSQNAIKQKMAFWVHKRVIREIKSSNCLMRAGSLTIRRSLTNPPMSGYFGQESNDSDVTIYTPVRVYENPSVEDDTALFEENENEVLLKRETHNHFENAQFTTLIEGLIKTMLNTNGPKSAEKIHNLLRTVYKTDIDYPYNEAKTKEILKNLILKKEIIYNGELYSVMN